MSFIERELEKITDAIRKTSEQDGERIEALRVAQCALSWATDPDCFMSPSNYLAKFHSVTLPPTDGTGIATGNPAPAPLQS